MKKQELSELRFKLLYIVSIIWKFKRKDTTASCLLPSQTPSERREDYYATSRREHLQTERWPVGGSLYSWPNTCRQGGIWVSTLKPSTTSRTLWQRVSITHSTFLTCNIKTGDCEKMGQLRGQFFPYNPQIPCKYNGFYRGSARSTA